MARPGDLQLLPRHAQFLVLHLQLDLVYPQLVKDVTGFLRERGYPGLRSAAIFAQPGCAVPPDRDTESNPAGDRAFRSQVWTKDASLRPLYYWALYAKTDMLASLKKGIG
jgi:hypothetical protein